MTGNRDNIDSSVDGEIDKINVEKITDLPYLSTKLAYAELFIELMALDRVTHNFVDSGVPDQLARSILFWSVY